VTAERLASLPDALVQAEADERAAEAELESAQASLREAEATLERARRASDRIAAERDVQWARDEVKTLGERVAVTRRSRERLVADGDAWHADAERLAARAWELAGRVQDVPAPGCGLDGALEWASRSRGALLLERSGLAREREATVREASELLAGVLGEPMTATAVTGIRDRLVRALGEVST
jgi:hypothetical protein